MTTKMQIKELQQQGVKPLAIAVRLGVTKQHVYRCLRDNEEPDGADAPPLNVKNYTKAVERGCGTKEDLAKHFCVRKKTLLSFEKESGVTQLLAKYHYIQGESFNEIGQALHVRVGAIEIPPDFPTIEKVRRDLISILEVYGKMAECGDVETVRYNGLKKALDKL